MSKPIHRYWDFDQARNIERLGMRIAGERLESKLGQAARRHRRAAVPRWRKNGIRLRSKQLSQQALAFLNVTALRQIISFGAELTFLAVGFVVKMRVAVLMNPQTLWMGRHAPRQFLRGNRIQRGRYGGEINRDIEIRKNIQQQQKTIVAPAAIIVTEEQTCRIRQRVKRITHRYQPGRD